MRRGGRWGVLGACLGLWGLIVWVVLAWSDPATHALPDQGRQHGQWAGDGSGAYAVSGCQPAVPGASLTLAAFACEGYGKDSTTGELVYASQASHTLGAVSATSPSWLLLRADTSTVPASWTCIAGTLYCHRQSSSQPAQPTRTLLFAKVTTSGGVISGVTWLAPRQPVETHLKHVNVASRATGGTGSSASPWTGWETKIDWTYGTQEVVFPAGHYTQVAPILVTGMRTHIHGAGKQATVIHFTPTGAPGDTLAGTKTQAVFTFGNSGATVHYQSSLRGLALLSSDTTTRKTGISLIDTSEFYLADVQVGAGAGTWTGDTSKALWVFGRELGVIERVDFNGDVPITISDNPNSSIDIDQFTFRDIYLLGTANSGASGANPSVQIDSGVNLTNVNFIHNEWVRGSDGLYWVDTTGAAASLNLTVRDTRWEQSSSAGGYMLRVEHNNSLQNLLVDNLYGGLSNNGVRLRNVRGAVFAGLRFTRAGGECVNLDSSSYPVLVVNGFCQSGSTIGVGTLTKVYDSSQFDATTLPLRHYDASDYVRPTSNGVILTKALRRMRTTLTYSASMTPDARDANFFTIEVTDANAMTINDAANKADGDEMCFKVSNQSGGAMGVITWAAAYKLAGAAFVNPANATNKTICFERDTEIPNGNWHEYTRSSADVAN